MNIQAAAIPSSPRFSKSVNTKNPQSTTGLQPDVIYAGLSETNVANPAWAIKGEVPRPSR